MKKITLSLFFLLAMVMSGYGQVTYNFGWEPSAPPLGGWGTAGTAGAFSRNTALQCSGVASVRANIYYGKTTTLTSPLLESSNGGLVTFSFDYKVTKYSSPSTGAPAADFTIISEWANSSSGPWFEIGIVNSSNHAVSASCATKTFEFSPSSGNLFVRMKATAIATTSDLYIYFDNVSISQGVEPSCVSPSSTIISNLTGTSADVTWPAVVPSPETGYEYYYSNINAAPTVAGTATTNLVANLTDLTSNTNYYFWVRSVCGTEQAVWRGPFIFRTFCDSFSIPFEETFNSDSSTEACWSIINANGDSAQWDMNYNSGAINGNQSAVMITDNLAGANDDWLISPKITLTGAERLKFKYKVQSANEPNDFMVKLSTTGNQPADFTTVLMPLTAVNNTTAATKMIPLNAFSGDVFIAFHLPPGGLDGWRLYIDDILFELAPTEGPSCIEDMSYVINEGCGNFPTNFSWPAVPAVDGYKVSIGTSPGGLDLVVDNQDIGMALTYSFVGIPGTTYYYTIKPYAGDFFALDCFEDSFTTFDDGCYCVVAPQYLDGQGISNVQVGDTNFPVNAVSYQDLTENGVVNITQGINNMMNVTFKTGFTYNTNIWIDLNDDYVFDTSELVFVGESAAQNPTVLNTTFSLSTTATIGEHRMRIVATDNIQTPANPCYNGTYGIVIDLLVDVNAAPDCLPATASTVTDITADSATINWVSEGTLFNLEFDFAGSPQGGGTVVSGISGNTYTLTDLDSQANYTYYIQTDCGDNSLSPWAGPFTFRTGCGSLGDFIENFNTEVTVTAPECWSTLLDATNTIAYVSVSSYADEAEFYNSSDINASLYLITPVLTALPLATHRINFKAFADVTGNSIIIGTMTNPSDKTTFTAVQSFPITTTVSNYSVAFINVTTDTHIAFKTQFGLVDEYIYLDDVVWEPTPSCLPPSLPPTINDITINAATINWIASPIAPANGYDFFYTTDLMMTPITTTIPSGSVDAGITTANLFALQSSSIYNVFVRGVCTTSDQSSWTQAGNFSTNCVNPTLPYTIDFENAVVPNLPICTTSQNVGNGNNWKTKENPGNGFTGRVLNYSYSSTNPANTWFYAHPVTLEAGNTYSVSYQFSNTGTAFPEKMKVAYGSIANSTAMINQLADHPSINTSTLQSNSVTFTPAVSGAYVIGFNAYSATNQNQLYLDNIVIQEVLGASDFDNKSFTAYPNPVKDVLNVSSTQNISDVAVYNLLGQQVLFMNINANKGQVDMSSLAAGTYLVKVNSDNGVKTIKVIKE